MRAILISALVTLPSAQAVVAQRCDAILQYGVWEVYEGSASVESQRALYHYMRNQQLRTNTDSRSVDVNGRLEVFGIPVDLGGSASKQQIDRMFELVEREDFEVVRTSATFSTFRTSVSRPILDAWLSCQNQVGFHASLSQSVDPQHFWLTLRFVPIAGTTGDGRLTRIEDVDPPLGIECANNLEAGTVVTEAEHRYRCTRGDGAFGELNLRATLGSDVYVTFPRRVVVPPPTRHTELFQIISCGGTNHPDDVYAGMVSRSSGALGCQTRSIGWTVDRDSRGANIELFVGIRPGSSNCEGFVWIDKRAGNNLFGQDVGDCSYLESAGFLLTGGNGPSLFHNGERGPSWCPQTRTVSTAQSGLAFRNCGHRLIEGTTYSPR